MVVKSSKVRVRTGGLQNAYVSIMASSPVLEEEQPENQLGSNPKHSLIFEVARGGCLMSDTPQPLGDTPPGQVGLGKYKVGLTLLCWKKNKGN